MGAVEKPRDVMMILAAFSRDDYALDWAREWGCEQWGDLALESPRFQHDETNYYDAEMGVGLKKTFYAFEQLIAPDTLVSAKLLSNAAEFEYAALSDSPKPRPLNLDPGYLNDSKFLLATTKDHAHRIYLSDGIYAEITLRFQKGAWQPWDWTYPDYRREDYRAFFLECRKFYRALGKDNVAK